MPAKKPVLPPLEDLRMLRLPRVVEYVGLSESRIRQLELAGDFPRRVALGDNAIAWREVDVRRWLASRVQRGEVKVRGAAKPPCKRYGRAAKTTRKGV
jgi:prophage regulatory protein